MPWRRTISILSIAWLFCAAPMVSRAAEKVSFTTTDGRAFSEVTVTRVVGRKLEVMTPQGVQLVRFANLPRELQERFFPPSMLHPPKVGDVLDFKTVGGKAYHGPLREIAPNGISIGTPDGVDKVAYSNLPPELANTFEYDAEDAARYEATLRAQQHRAALARQAAEKKAVAQRATAEKNAAKAQPKRSSPTNDPGLGSRGSKSLGAPKLGGRGLGK